MTTPGAVNPSPSVHNAPPEKKGNVRRLTAKQLGVIGTVMVELILAQVALALGGINILGVHPFGYLTQWGQNLQTRASDAYNKAMGAESAANTAQTAANAAQGSATTANTGLVTTWNNLWDASFNTTGSTGKTAADVYTAQGQVYTTATSGVSLAGTAQTAANSAQSTANTASTNAQDTIDGIYGAIMGGTFYNQSVTTVQDKIGGLADYSRGVAGAGTNLLPDPGAEKSVFWTGQTGAARSSTYKRNGSYSVALTSAGSTARTLYFNVIDTGAVQPYAVRADEIYYVECWVYSPSGDPNGTVELIAQTNGSTITAITSQAFTSSNRGTWVQLYGQYTIGSSTTSVSFGVRLASSATTSGKVFYVDDMLVREITRIQNSDNAVYNGLTGEEATDATAADVEQASLNASGSITELSGKVTGLESQTAGNAFAGKSISEIFANYSDGSLPATWTTTYTSTGTSTGSVQVVGGRVAWVSGGLDKRRAMLIFNNTYLTSDYHRVGAVFATKPNYSSSYPPAQYLIARSNTAATTCVYAKIYGVTGGLLQPTKTKVEVWCVVSGSATKLGDGTISEPIQYGATYWLEAGTSAGLHKYRVLRDTKALLSVTTESEVTPTSKVGADFVAPNDYRYCGFGLEANAGSTAFKPAQIGAWTAYDNTPAPLLGSGFKISRTSTSTVSASGTGSYLFPQNFFDSSPEANTSDYTYSDTSGAPGKLTVGTAGWYAVALSVGFNTGVGDQNFWPLLYKNGSIVQRGGPSFGTGLGTSARGMHSTFLVYLSKDDYLQVGYQTGGGSVSNLFTGDAGGQNTHWSVTFLNNTKPVQPTTT